MIDPSARDRMPGVGGRRALAVAFVSGVAVMNSEIGAGRLLAPYYGTSTTVWALLIAAVLTSLALGNLLAARLLQAQTCTTWLRRLLLTASALLLLLPWLAPLFLSGSLDRWRQGQVVALAAALVGLALLLALPLVLLGALSPLLLAQTLRQCAKEPTQPVVARVTGQLNAAGTLGSLLGTLAAGLLLIPWLGTRATITLGAAALALVALLIPARSRAAQWLSLIVIAAVAMTLVRSFMPLRHAAAGCIFRGESRYNYIAVFETHRERQLRLNDGYAVQSYASVDGSVAARDVWAYYALAPTWGSIAAPGRVLILGLGGGTVVRIYRDLYPNAQLTGVELDARVVEAGQRYLGTQLKGVEVVIQDARSFVMQAQQRQVPQYDTIILDAFQFPYVPFQLATEEFFIKVAQLLRPGGVFMVNAGRHDQYREVVCAMTRTLATAFAHVQYADPPNPSNTVLVATQHRPLDAVGVRGLRVPPATTLLLAQLARTYAPMRPARWPPETPRLTDDRAPIEWLTDRIVWQTLWHALVGNG